MRYILLAMPALVSRCGNARAWGDEGHKIVSEIASRVAQPDTRSAMRRLIRSDTEFDTPSESCLFPGHPRNRCTCHSKMTGDATTSRSAGHRSGKLHSTRDTCLVENVGIDVAGVVDELIDAITPKMKTMWNASGPGMGKPVICYRGGGQNRLLCDAWTFV